MNVVVEKQASWPVVRDKLASGELHGAHCLFGMPFAAATKVSELRVATQTLWKHHPEKALVVGTRTASGS